MIGLKYFRSFTIIRYPAAINIYWNIRLNDNIKLRVLHFNIHIHTYIYMYIYMNVCVYLYMYI